MADIINNPYNIPFDNIHKQYKLGLGLFVSFKIEIVFDSEFPNTYSLSNIPALDYYNWYNMEINDILLIILNVIRCNNNTILLNLKNNINIEKIEKESIKILTRYV